MMNFAEKRHLRLISAFLSIMLIFSLAVSIAGNVIEGNCDDGCQEESGACCECICCPNKVLMTAYDEINLQAESSSFLWTIQRISLFGEQEWFIPIDHPPQNFS